MNHSSVPFSAPASVLTIRAYSGLSGDIFLAGLARLTEIGEEELDAFLRNVLPQLAGTVKLGKKTLRHISGSHLTVSLPQEHTHRRLSEIFEIIEKSPLQKSAKDKAQAAFTLIAKAEADVHNTSMEDVHFHEVGALDSILDICMTCELFTRLAPDLFVVSPLPLADGAIVCDHGVLPSPAPAVIKMLDGVQITGFPGRGETVTPTALALLRVFNAAFGPWPSMCVKKHAFVYGSKVFPDAPNGALFVTGTSLETKASHSPT